MDCGSDNVAENEKYSFLLGSAIRNEDTDQFISIYDRIIPKDLPDSQIHSIKEKARWFAELPEEEFNCLVARARNFSLAPSTMSVSTQPDSKYLRYHSEEEDEGLGTAKVKQSDTFSLYSSHTEKATLNSSESDVRRYDEDSGVCNSSKATDSIESLSDQDASEGERIGCYDYFPQSQVKIHSGGGLHLDYDEVHEVQSDRSSQDVTSPRSDVEIEMTEIGSNRPERNCDGDFYTDDESDDDQNIHQSLYSSRSSYRADYNHMHRESKEEYAQFFSPNFEGSKGTWGSSAHSGLRSQVDDKISFSSLGGNIYSRYSNPYPRSEKYTSSEKVKIEKNFYPNTTSKPPFGDGQDQLEKVGRSIQPLLGGISDAPAPNMPEARKLIPLTSEDNKKKKKKKKVPKDELAEKYEKDSLSGPHDENGNPLESIPPTSVYRQMRESSALGLRGANPSSKSTYGTAGGFPQTINSFDFYQHNNNQIKDLELDDSPSSSKQLKKRKQKKDNKVKEQKSEDIDNYKGNISDIDELVKFIAGNDVGNKKNKKCPLSTVATTATTDIPSKGEKNNKKVKDKKQKSTIPFSAAEEDKKEIIVIKEGNSDPVTSKLEVHSVREDKDCLDKKMGNSSAKTECKLTDNHQGGTITVFDEERLASLLTDGDEMGKLNIGSNKSLVISSSIIDLQCPENNKISSIKDKQAESDLAPTANNDIGEVHKNQEDKKWTEGGVEMTDKTVQIESSVNQCVKQKNLKNFKSKSASSSAFVSSDSLTKPISPTSHIEEIGIGNGNSPFTVNSDIVDNTFIFTDIDNLHPVPKEDEFQVVGKKKKKVKDSNHLIRSRRVFHPANISSEEKHLYASGGKKSFSKQIPVTAIPIVTDTDKKQDLSQAAFPALAKTSSKCRKSLPDGRRNSTGEVPIPSEVCVKHLDDSDIESVKSLPVNTFSDFPRKVASYASKAASTRPAGNKTSIQASPIPQSKERKEEAKYQVWKGSPTERRHSVGSKPENKSSGSKEPESQLHRTWCGSSETVVIEDDNAGIYTGEESDLKLGKIKSSNRVAGGDGSIDNKQIDTSSTVANDNAFVRVQSNSSLSASSSQSSIGSSDSKPSSVTNLTQTVCEKELHKELKPSVHKLKMDNNHKQIIKTVTTKTVTNNNNKKLKQKSVIFLDKKVTEVPANLDITFGFELCAEKNEFVQSAKDELAVCLDLEEIKNNSSSAAVSVEADSLSAPNMVIQVSQNSPLITNSSKSGSCVISQFDRSVSSDSSMQTSGKPQTEYKISHIKGINGVVQPSTQGPSQHSSSDTAHNTSNIDNSSTDNSKPLNDQEISSYRDSKSCNSRKEGMITVLYGENLCHVKKESVPDGSNKRTTPYCGHIGFILESGDVQGNSNIVDAASFLQREWRRVLEQQEQDPSSVTVLTV